MKAGALTLLFSDALEFWALKNNSWHIVGAYCIDFEQMTYIEG